MKKLVIVLAALLYSTLAYADHTGMNESDSAEINASCAAAFNLGCPSTDLSDQTYIVSSSGFAAPAGVLGDSPQELALLVVLSAGALYRRRYRTKTEHRFTSE